jgi:hypothetical protein
MTYRGHIKNGQVTLDDPVSLPEGAEVSVAVIENGVSAQSDLELPQLLLRHAGKGKNLPRDLAAQHDHYAHGKAKR